MVALIRDSSTQGALDRLEVMSVAFRGLAHLDRDAAWIHAIEYDRRVRTYCHNEQSASSVHGTRLVV